MAFQKKSLKSLQRKKNLKTAGRHIGIVGKSLAIFSVGAALFVPRLVWGALRKKEKRRRARMFLRISFSLIFVTAALAAGLLWTEEGRNAGKSIAKETLFALGSDLPKDENGYTNMLLLGAGGGAHEGKGTKLTDSIMIASLDIPGRSVVMLSVPRDFYVETDRMRGRINAVVRDESALFLRQLKASSENATQLRQLVGQERQQLLWDLEEQADWQAIDILKEKMEEIFRLEIHRVARIDFQGFEQVVDAIGGIDVVVEEAIYDPTYPDAEWGYSPFRIEAGPQKLDGATALKYARSRHGTSDFDRAQRQQTILTAIREKMTSLEMLTSPSRLKDVFDVVQENFRSDLSWNEMITLAKFADKLPRERIITHVLNDDPSQPGGFLVTPSRELYGGAFVLVPYLNLEADKYAQIRVFTDIIFRYRNLAGIDPLPIEILNGTRTSGLAGSLETHLERYGWEIPTIDNAEDFVDQTVVEFTDTPANWVAAELLQRFFPIELRPITEEDRIEALPAESVEAEGQEPAEAADTTEAAETGRNESLPESENAPVEPTEPQDVFRIIIGDDYETPYRIPLFPKQQ